MCTSLAALNLINLQTFTVGTHVRIIHVLQCTAIREFILPIPPPENARRGAEGFGEGPEKLGVDNCEKHLFECTREVLVEHLRRACEREREGWPQQHIQITEQDYSRANVFSNSRCSVPLQYCSHLLVSKLFTQVQPTLLLAIHLCWIWVCSHVWLPAGFIQPIEVLLSVRTCFLMQSYKCQDAKV